jgi:hypothetical protein
MDLGRQRDGGDGSGLDGSGDGLILAPGLAVGMEVGEAYEGSGDQGVEEERDREVFGCGGGNFFLGFELGGDGGSGLWKTSKGKQIPAG